MKERAKLLAGPALCALGVLINAVALIWEIVDDVARVNMVVNGIALVFCAAMLAYCIALTASVW